MSRYFSHPSGGPVWSRTLGYHKPHIPAHIWRIINRPKPEPKPERIDSSSDRERK